MLLGKSINPLLKKYSNFSYRIVNKLRGKMVVQLEAGKGSTFRFTIAWDAV